MNIFINTQENKGIEENPRANKENSGTHKWSELTAALALDVFLKFTFSNLIETGSLPATFLILFFLQRACYVLQTVQSAPLGLQIDLRG